MKKAKRERERDREIERVGERVRHTDRGTSITISYGYEIVIDVPLSVYAEKGKDRYRQLIIKLDGTAAQDLSEDCT